MPAPSPRPTTGRGPSGVWRATVTRVVPDEGIYVTIPRLAGIAYEWGPSWMLSGPWTPGAITDGVLDEVPTEVAAGPEPHVHQMPHVHPLGVPIDAGDRVLIAFVEGRPNDVVVLGRF